MPLPKKIFRFEACSSRYSALAARYVIELVAEVSIAGVEVDVEQQICQGDGPGGRHARCEERLLVGVWSWRG